MNVSAWIAQVSLPAAPVDALFISFMVYAFIGWVWESTACSLMSRGYFANSGFLLGPFCPVYGVGALACWLSLESVANPWVQFLAAALLCCAIEYAAGVILEHTTQARFWDYRRYPFNLHGRICLYGALIFGGGALAVCRVVEPALLGVLGLLPPWILHLLSAVLFCMLVVDLASSLASWKRLSAQLDTARAELAERIDDSLRSRSDALLERVPDAALDSAVAAQERGHALNAWLSEVSDAALDALRERGSLPAFITDGAAGIRLAARRMADAAPRPTLTRRDLRFFNAFPDLRMLHYEGVIRATRLRDRVREMFGR